MANQHGFTPLHTVLMLVFAALVVGTGYYVYQATNKADDALSNAEQGSVSSVKKQTKKVETQSQEKVTPGSDDEAQLWKEVGSSKKGFSLRIPDGWEVINDISSDNMISQKILEYKRGTSAKIENVQIGGGDQIYRFTARQFSISENVYYLDGDETKSEFTTGLVKGSRYYKKYPIEEPKGIGAYPGMERYVYEFKKDNKITVITYSIFNYNEYSARIISLDKSDPNQLELVEKMVKTLKVN